jgi:hypothetical protein
VQLPYPRIDAADYEFHLAVAYETMGERDKAHLHYEIIHDHHRNSIRYEEATRRMTMLRNKPRVRVFGLWEGGNSSETDTETPSMNPHTLAEIGEIWPSENQNQLEEAVYFEEAVYSSSSSFGYKYDPNLLKGIPLREGNFQLLDSPYFGPFQQQQPVKDGPDSNPPLRYGPSFRWDGPPLVF